MSNPDPDVIWVQRCAAGDERALKALVDRYQSLVFGLSRRYLGNAEDAEEVAIATFLKFWKSASAFRGTCSVRAYLCQIALNLCRDRPKAKPLAMPCAESNGTSAQFDMIVAALSHLPEDDRDVLVLYYLDELEYEEICESLEIGYDALKTRLVRARKRLRTLLVIENE